MKGNGISVSKLQASPLMPEEVTYQSKLRAAMSGGISEADVCQVVEGIVEAAKMGDPSAQKMFFEYLLGVKNAPTKIVVNNHYGSVEDAALAEIEERKRRLRA